LRRRSESTQNDGSRPAIGIRHRAAQAWSVASCAADQPVNSRDRVTVRRSLVIGLAAIAGAVALFAVLPASATHVSPTTAPGNPACPPGTTTLKVEPVADGTFTDGTLTVTIDVRDTAAGQVFDWTSNIGVDQVIAKGGPNANIYTYVGESTGDTGLHAPANASGKFAGLSHISFCYDADQPPTTPPTTTPPTTTPPTTPTSTSITTETPTTSTPPTSTPPTSAP
jgi:hypothetical protein